ncbi:hypothetical protein BHE74_00051043, partial [Ensete ventricosum]
VLDIASFLYIFCLLQHQLWNLAQRTTALPFGRGAFTLASTYAVLTEALHVPKLVLAGRLPAQQNATIKILCILIEVSHATSCSYGLSLCIEHHIHTLHLMG